MQQHECKVCGRTATNEVKIESVPVTLHLRANGQPTTQVVKQAGPFYIWLCDEHANHFDNHRSRISE